MEGPIKASHSALMWKKMPHEMAANALPVTALAKVLGSCSLQELFPLRRVCRRWRHIADSNQVWRAVLTRRFPKLELPKHDFFKNWRTTIAHGKWLAHYTLEPTEFQIKVGYYLQFLWVDERTLFYGTGNKQVLARDLTNNRQLYQRFNTGASVNALWADAHSVYTRSFNDSILVLNRDTGEVKKSHYGWHSRGSKCCGYGTTVVAYSQGRTPQGHRWTLGSSTWQETARPIGGVWCVWADQHGIVGGTDKGVGRWLHMDTFIKVDETHSVTRLWGNAHVLVGILQANTSGATNQLHIWDRKTGALIQSLPYDHRGAIRPIAGNSRSLFLCVPDGAITELQPAKRLIPDNTDETEKCN